jgi:tetratricopeptide (TPR) repeat protein
MLDRRQSGCRLGTRLQLGVVAMFASFVAVEARASVSVGSGTLRPGTGVSSMSESYNGSLLVEYFKAFLDDRDLDSFRNRVAARYNDGTLCRILSTSSDVAARRAAVLSLGILGGFDGCNAALGKALGDSDASVRGMAEDALWAVWFRADTPEHNQMLEKVRLAIGREEFVQAELMVTRLIADSPNFAEAYNQRAIIYFHQGRFAESVLDCQRVLSRNPYHFGALSGMAGCQLELKRPHDALKSLRRGLKLQPYHNSLRETIRALETQIEPDGLR